MKRVDLSGYPSRVLNNESGLERQAQVVLYDVPQGKVVLKEWKPASGLVLRWWSRLCIQREIANYRRLSGIPGIPRLLDVFDERSFALEYIDGEPVHPGIPRAVLLAGLDSLERLLEELHTRRFVHLDARSGGNILIDKDGKAWLIDLVQGVDCSRGIFGRLLFPFFRWVDRSAVKKHRARYAPDTLDPRIRAHTVAKYSRHRRNWFPMFGRWFIGLFARRAEPRTDPSDDSETPSAGAAPSQRVGRP